MLAEEQVSTHVLDHLGLVAAVIQKIGLVEKIDVRLPTDPKKGVKVTMGERVAAMIFNGLGFVDDRLYMFPEFCENKPIKRFFADHVEAAYFNDDTIGRALDAIDDYGTTPLFSELAFETGLAFGLLGKTARFDTTSLTVYGDYAAEGVVTPTTNQEPLRITHGYSKDGRPDLKQVILNLATTGHAHLPIWMAAHNGNASDKVVLQQQAERMKIFAKALKDAPSFIYVGDSALYERCVETAGDMLWLSRVPHTHKKVHQFLNTDGLKMTPLEKGYSVSEAFHHTYKGVMQRWVVVSSEQMYKREAATLEKRIVKEQEAITKKLKQLRSLVFGCEKDALKALPPVRKALKYHSLEGVVEEVRQHERPGKPKKGSIAGVVGYRLATTLMRDEATIERYRREQGSFILATNQLNSDELSNVEMLQEYKQQTHTERGFRFIKGDAFEVSGVFLKKPTRVRALMMVMTLCLMVYALAQHFLRQALEERDETIPDQLKKPTKTPTMAWICRKFYGIQVLYVKFADHVQEMVTNLTELLKRIIRYFGPVAEKIYGLSG